ncbi:Putative proline/betaine transporter [Durusdinium trenchii]|uniref:Proline/betaine transporter n=1 Tax=Durusdinium trenchii TaxID=1381693 RepID=A0ABP0S7L2_9DINO
MGAGKDVCHVIKTYWSLLLGNLLEWYEFCLFSFLEPYFEANFFQGSALAAWLGFAITFVARPFGGVALGLVGDVLGRKVSTFLSIFGMLCGTVLQGVLPTYKNGHVAGTLGLSVLILLRLLQGVCTGGEIAAVTTYLTEIGEPRSLSSSLLLVPVTATVGFFAGQLMTFSFEWFLGEEQMMDWGWRIPFLLALFPGLLATMGRRCIPESGLFLRAKEESEITSSKSATSRAISKTREAWQCILSISFLLALITILIQRNIY